VTTAAVVARTSGDPDDGVTRAGLTLPSLREVGRHAAPQVVEGALIPLGLFLVVMALAGVGAAMAAGLGCRASRSVRRGWSGAAASRP